MTVRKLPNLSGTIFLSALILFLAGSFRVSADLTGFRFEGEPGEKTTLLENGRPLWRYNAAFAAVPRVPEKDPRRMAACYIHPLYGIDGETLTDDGPKDHYHHHGVFWTWPHVVVHRPDGKSEHYSTWMGDTRLKQLFLKVDTMQVDADKAVFAVENGWFLGSEVNRFERDEQGEPVSERLVTEKVVVTTRPIREVDGLRTRAIDLDFTWTIGACPISLRGAGGKSYGGLTLRFRPSQGKPGGKSVITVPDGPAATDLPETPLPWADYTSLFHRDGNDKPVGEPSGAAIFVSPGHPDFPPTWLTRYYGPLCVGWPGVRERTFRPGETIRLSYRIWIHDKAVDVDTLQDAYEEYRREILYGKDALTYRNPGPATGDPSILRKTTGEVVSYDGKYYLYYTGGTPNAHSFACRSTTDFVRWKDEGVVFDGKGTWARSAYWAPETYEIDGRYYLFFSAQNSELPWTQEEHFNIGVAVSDRPTGPFRLIEDKPIFEPGYPIIDANLFIDDDGAAYLTYSRCCYRHPVESELAELAKREGWFEQIEESWVYGVRLAPDFKTVVGEPVLLLRPPVRLDDKQAEWESRSVTHREINRRWTEGSTLFKHAGRYYLMYSGNNFMGDYYAVGYATSDRPLGPYVKAANNPVLEKNNQRGGKVRGTGHNNVFFSPDRKEMYCVYHGRTEGDRRRFFFDRMEIDSTGVLRVYGPSTTPRTVPGWIIESSR